jgi:hypothetical protein
MEIPLTDWEEYTDITWTISAEIPGYHFAVIGIVEQRKGSPVYWPSVMFRPGDKNKDQPCVSLKDAQTVVLNRLFKEDERPDYLKGHVKWIKTEQTFWVLSCIEGFLRIKIWKEGDEFKGTINNREVRTYERLSEAKASLLGSLYMIVAISYDQVMSLMDPEYKKGVDAHNKSQEGR